jgi:hypothetical protein
MMRVKVEPYVVPTMVRAMPTIVQAAIQIAKKPQMTTPQETQLREQR